MKRALVTAAFVTFLCAVPWRASADTVLKSAPLKAGAGGAVCACGNLTGRTIVVDITLQDPVGGTVCTDQPVHRSSPATCPVGWTSVVTCRVSRDDGKTPSTKHLACTLSALDANGNPVAVVPVDKKLKY